MTGRRRTPARSWWADNWRPVAWLAAALLGALLMDLLR